MRSVRAILAIMLPGEKVKLKDVSMKGGNIKRRLKEENSPCGGG
jgi:hypothetical protein